MDRGETDAPQLLSSDRTYSTYACICRGASPDDRRATRRAGGRTERLVVERGTVETDVPGHVWLHDGEGPFLDGELLPAEEPDGSVGEANAGAIVHGDRTPDREVTLLAEHYRA